MDNAQKNYDGPKKANRERDPVVSTWIQTQVFRQYFQDRRACILETIKDLRDNQTNNNLASRMPPHSGNGEDDWSTLGNPVQGGRSAAQVFTDNQYYKNVLFSSCMNSAGWIRMPENLPVR